MRRNELDPSTCSRDAMKFRDEAHRVGHMLKHVTAYHLIEFVIVERVRKDAKIVYDIGCRARVAVHADRARILVCAAAHIKNLSALKRRTRWLVGLNHKRRSLESGV